MWKIFLLRLSSLSVFLLFLSRYISGGASEAATIRMCVGTCICSNNGVTARIFNGSLKMTFVEPFLTDAPNLLCIFVSDSMLPQQPRSVRTDTKRLSAAVIVTWRISVITTISSLSSIVTMYIPSRKDTQTLSLPLLVVLHTIRFVRHCFTFLLTRRMSSKCMSRTSVSSRTLFARRSATSSQTFGAISSMLTETGTAPSNSIDRRDADLSSGCAICCILRSHFYGNANLLIISGPVTVSDIAVVGRSFVLGGAR